jgi:hypothetical protein
VAVVDPLDNAVEDSHSARIIPGAAKGALCADEQAVEVERAVRQQPREIGVSRL